MTVAPNTAADAIRKAAWTPLGDLLREWRAARGLSQLQLALMTDISARHLSFVETGKSQPSRDLVSGIAEALDMPLRERNALMLAAGYAPPYRETPLAAPEMDLVRRAVEVTLRQQDPFPAYVLDRRWDVVDANGGMVRLLAALRPGGARNTNLLLQVFDPEDLRPYIANWPELAGDLLRHLHYEVTRAPTDPRPRSLLARILALPDIPPHWRRRDLTRPPTPVISTVLRAGERELRFFSTLTTFGSACDVTTDEMRIECLHPSDEATRRFCEALRDGAASHG